MKKVFFAVVFGVLLMGASDTGGCGYNGPLPDCVWVTPPDGGQPYKICQTNGGGDGGSTCTCQYGCYSDGSCRPSGGGTCNCQYGCYADGSCKPSGGGTCTCQYGCYADGSCKPSGGGTTGNLITLQPANLTVHAGQSASFNIVANENVSSIYWNNTGALQIFSCSLNSLTKGGTSVCTLFTNAASSGVQTMSITASSNTGASETETLTVNLVSGSGGGSCGGYTCSSNQVCNNNTCMASGIGNGGSCSYSNQCQSGNCSNGTCQASGGGNTFFTAFWMKCDTAVQMEFYTGSGTKRLVDAAANQEIGSNPGTSGETTSIVQGVSNTHCTCRWQSGSGQSTGSGRAQCYWNGPPQN